LLLGVAIVGVLLSLPWLILFPELFFGWFENVSSPLVWESLSLFPLYRYLVYSVGGVSLNGAAAMCTLSGIAFVFVLLRQRSGFSVEHFVIVQLCCLLFSPYAWIFDYFIVSSAALVLLLGSAPMYCKFSYLVGTLGAMYQVTFGDSYFPLVWYPVLLLLLLYLALSKQDESSYCSGC
jgi:hypothetical protein